MMPWPRGRPPRSAPAAALLQRAARPLANAVSSQSVRRQRPF